MNAPSRMRLDNAELITARRFDVVGLLKKPFRRPSDGAVLAEGVICREGVQKYKLADGTTRLELVTRQAVLDTAKTIARAPMTLNHPPGGFVTKENADRFVTGDIDGRTTVEETAQGAFATISVALRRKDAIDAYEAGTAIELSPGYEVTLDETPGDHPIFGEYHASQVGRDCNHGAQVPKGRGVDVGLRTDSADAVQISPWQPPEPTRIDASKVNEDAKKLPAEAKEDAHTPAGDARTDSQGAHMKPDLVRLLALFGVRTDNEDIALAAAVPAAEKILTDAKKLRADAKEAEVKAEKFRADAEEAEVKVKAMEDEKEGAKADAPDLEAMEAEKQVLLKKVEELQGMLDAGKTKLKADIDELQGKMDALQGKHDALEAGAAKEKQDRADAADAAELTELQGLADKINVKHAGLGLKPLRHKLAKARLDSTPDDASDDYIGALVALVRADAATPRPSGTVYSANHPSRTDGGTTEVRQDASDDEFHNPARDARKKQRADAVAGGAR